MRDHPNVRALGIGGAIYGRELAHKHQARFPPGQVLKRSRQLRVVGLPFQLLVQHPLLYVEQRARSASAEIQRVALRGLDPRNL